MGIIERVLYFLLRVFPNAWTPTLTGAGGMTVSPPNIIYADYAFIGKELVWISLQFITTLGGIPSTIFLLSLPFYGANDAAPVPCNFYPVGGSTLYAAHAWVSNTGPVPRLHVKRADGAVFANGSYLFSFSGIIRRRF